MASSLRLFQNTHMSISTKDALHIELVDGAVKQDVTSSYCLSLSMMPARHVLSYSQL